MSDEFKPMGEHVTIDAGKVKAPQTTAPDSEAAHGERNARLVKESNRTLS
jgi:hypothetical protein